MLTKDEIIQKVKDIIVDKLNVKESEITMQSSFIDDLGADSLDRVETVMEFEKQFELAISDEKAEKIATVGEAVDLIEEILKERGE